MMKRYSNQNHAIHRSMPTLSKTASVYDKQGISNRGKEEKSLSFSSLSPYESESILSVLKKEAAALDAMELNKEAANIASPFDTFKTAKNYIASKLGVGDDHAHALASGVVGKAQELQKDIGGDLENVVGGIIDSMDAVEVQNRIGAFPMRKSSPIEVEEHIKVRLMEELQLSSFQADQVTKSVVTQARNLSTRFRSEEVGLIADAIVSVIVNHQDVSLVYGIASSEWLVAEVESHLKNG